MSYPVLHLWEESALRDHYSRCVGFYRHMVNAGYPLDTDLLTELRYLIEDCYDLIWFRDVTMAEDGSQDKDYAEFCDLKDEWREQHPEWYMHDYLKESAL